MNVPSLAVGLTVVALFGANIAYGAPAGTHREPSLVETPPTGIRGDTADDPAIWVNSSDPGRSLIIANEKGAHRLTVYDLAGNQVQQITEPPGFFGNVDVRDNLVVAAASGIMVWRVVSTSTGPLLRPAREIKGNAQTAGEGLCLWDRGASGVAGGLFAINVHRTQFRVRVHPLTDADSDGLLLVEPPVRDFRLSSEAEGCEATAAGELFLAEEDVGIWRYDLTAQGGSAPPRTMFAPISPYLSPDIEGIAIASGILFASAQNVAAPRNNWVRSFSLSDGAHRGSFRVVDGLDSDDCDQTDGIDAYAGYLGELFPEGIFVCQDGFNDAPGGSGSQDFKYVPIESVMP